MAAISFLIWLQGIWIDIGRPGEIHLRHHRGHTQRRGKQSEQREGRQIDFAGTDVVDPAQQFNLGREVAVAVDGPLGDAGAAAGKENRRRFIGAGMRGLVLHVVRDPGQKILQCCTAPEPFPADGQDCFDRRSPPTEQDAGELGLWDADKSERLRFGETGLEVSDPHPGVDQDRNGADLEQCEGQGEEFETGRHHQHGTHTAADADRLESQRHAAALPIELGETVLIVAGLLLVVPAGRDEDCRGLRLPACHLRQMHGNVGSCKPAH